jgi:type IV secretion system protein VirB2
MKNHKIVKFLFLFALFGFVTSGAFATTTTGLPWEGPLQTIQNSLKGPVAMSISIIAVVCLGAALIFGGELGDFARKAVMVALGVAFLVAADSVISTLFGSTAALLPACQHVATTAAAFFQA